MTIRLEDLGIQQMSALERLDLIEQIWDSLPDNLTAEEVPAWHLDELARRRAVEATPSQVQPWREALARFG